MTSGFCIGTRNGCNQNVWKPLSKLVDEVQELSSQWVEPGANRDEHATGRTLSLIDVGQIPICTLEFIFQQPTLGNLARYFRQRFIQTVIHMNIKVNNPVLKRCEVRASSGIH